VFVAATYFVLAKLGFGLASVHPAASPVWAPSGVALAAFLLLGLRAWPAVFAGALLVNLTILDAPLAAVIAAGNTLEGVVMALLLARFAGGAATFETPGRIARFSIVSLASGTVVGATIGSTALCLFAAASWSDFPSIWAIWWLGDSAGTLAVTPVAVLWALSRRRPESKIFTAENAVVFGSAVIVGLLAFSPVFEHSFVRVPIAFLTIAPLFVAALRLGPRDTATVALIVSLFAIWGTVSGSGPFAPAAGSGLNNSFLLLLSFMTSVMVPSLALSAEVTRRRLAERELRRQEGELRAIFRQALVGIAECDTEGRFVSVNDKLCEMTRRSESDLLGRSLHDLTDAEDLAQEAGLFAAARARGEGYVIEKRILWPDSTRRWMRGTVTPVVDRAGNVSRIAVMCEDITQRHNDEERQKLLMAELNHRVRNNLATIQAIARLTARGTSTKAEYVESLQGRVASMARIHSLLTRERWQGANLQDIVRDELSTYSRLNGVTFDGPVITLGTRHALDLALVIHELATNAVKFGALSTAEGRLDVNWHYEVVAGAPHLILRWEESGGPKVVAPARKGFGIYLIESALSGGGTKVALTFLETGLVCAIDLPMVRSEAEATAQQAEAATTPAPAPAPVFAAKASKSNTRRRVLLVEDDPVLGFELQSALSDSGLDVIGPARTLQEALILAADKQLAAAVLDIHLGGVMVYPVAEYLRLRALPILFITGYDIAAVAPEPLRNAPVMQKPINADDLVGRIRELMDAA
jgi:PAS domain S-box-containing protein